MLHVVRVHVVELVARLKVERKLRELSCVSIVTHTVRPTVEYSDQPPIRAHSLI